MNPLVLELLLNVHWEPPADLDGIHARNEPITALPASDPRSLWAHESNEPIKGWRGAVLDALDRGPQLEDFLAVVAAISSELRLGLDEGAEETGPQPSELSRESVHGFPRVP